MTFGDILQNLYDQLGYKETPEDNVQRRLKRFVNTTQSEILGKKGNERLRYIQLTFNTIANSPLVVLPQAVVSIRFIVDRTNSMPLDQVDLADIRWTDPALTSASSVPNCYTVLDYAASVARQPSVPSEVFAKSTSASDTQQVYVEGTTSGGYPRTEITNLNGVNPVSLDPAVSDWVTIQKFFVRAPAQGTITLTQTSGAGTELSRITFGRTYSRYTLLHLYPTPTGVNTYYLDGNRLVQPMVYEFDEPLLPDDFHFLLESGALAREFIKREKSDYYLSERSRFREGVGDMQVYLRKQGGAQPGNELRFSQLGSFFPPGT